MVSTGAPSRNLLHELIEVQHSQGCGMGSQVQAYRPPFVLLQSQANPEFKTKLEDALANYDGRKERTFTPEGIAEEAWCGYRCEQMHTLVPEKDLVQGRDLNAKEVQKAIPVVELFNHKNEKVKGVLIPEGLRISTEI
eukprot:5977982-Amphidinium_carterae.2